MGRCQLWLVTEATGMPSMNHVIFSGVFTVETLRRGSPELERSIRSVELISGSNRVEWKQTSECLRIEVGGRAPCAAAIAFRITFD
ncbi:MAG: hypothetical protein EVA58_03630 [Kiritimatiellaceae bacterium]|nr:MAG: hypothetical protein EVA58_03630 [Kiritimatiellaceae bacterium]